MPFEKVAHRFADRENKRKRKNYFGEGNTDMFPKRFLVIYVSFYKKIIYIYKYKKLFSILASANASILAKIWQFVFTDYIWSILYIKGPIFNCENVMCLKNNYTVNQWIRVNSGGKKLYSSVYCP